MALTVPEVREMLQTADAERFAVLERSLAADERKGVRQAVEVARRRIAVEAAEEERLARLYAFQEELAREHGAADMSCVVGLDEVGRGPVAGPLAVGAVVLPSEPRIPGLNDSKQVPPEKREEIAQAIRAAALAWTVEYVDAPTIDALGITASLKRAFAQAVRRIEEAGIPVQVVLLDGNPLHFDPREVNVVKGDAKCASIAAASLVAKVERDAAMCQLDTLHPGYGFAENKGYGSAAHVEAIRTLGLSPVHRASFCRNFLQETLF